MEIRDDNITIPETRKLIQIVSTLAKGRCFTRDEYLMIVAICSRCVDRVGMTEKIGE